jgi:uncharacterized protein YukE
MPVCESCKVDFKNLAVHQSRSKVCGGAAVKTPEEKLAELERRKQKVRETAAAWQRENRARHNENQKKWRANNPNRKAGQGKNEEAPTN